MKSVEKSNPPKIAPMIGMMRSFTSESTILPKAAPMMTPTARSITLPLTAKERNSESIPIEILLFQSGYDARAFTERQPLENPDARGPSCRPGVIGSCHRAGTSPEGREEGHGAGRLQRPPGPQRLPAHDPEAGQPLDRLRRPPRRQVDEPVDGQGGRQRHVHRRRHRSSRAEDGRAHPG